MLLIDGVRYELWVPKKEEEEFEPLVTDHISEIFGEQSVYIDIKHKMKTKSGIGSIPDGYVIVIDKIPSWHVIEMELSCHPLYDHIVTQMSKFNNGIKNHSTQKDIVDMFYNYIDDDEFLKMKMKKLIYPTELHKYLSDLIAKQPSITVIIEQKTEALQEALSALPFAATVVELKTFIREGVNNINVHAHIFEPLNKSKPILEIPIGRESGNRDSLEITLTNANIKYRYLYIPKKFQGLFPSSNLDLEFETDSGQLTFGFHNDKYGLNMSAGVSEWYKQHPDLSAGDKVRIEVVKPMAKYRIFKV